jgi:hypothetical protein
MRSFEDEVSMGKREVKYRAPPVWTRQALESFQLLKACARSILGEKLAWGYIECFNIMVTLCVVLSRVWVMLLRVIFCLFKENAFKEKALRIVFSARVSWDAYSAFLNTM